MIKLFKKGYKVKGEGSSKSPFEKGGTPGFCRGAGDFSVPSTTSRAFTIIELLVVISIIGMLSSVILVALQGARDKGVVSAGVKFATYNYRYLGANAALIWLFNEAVASSGAGSVIDTSGNGYNGNTNGTVTRGVSPSYNSSTAFSFGGAAIDFVSFNNTFKFNTNKGITLSAWINTADTDGVILDTAGGGIPALSVSSSKVFFTDNVAICDVTSNKVINDSKWHNVTLVLANASAGGSFSRIYIDGKLDGTPCNNVSSIDFSANGYNTATTARVGRNLTATLDDIMAFNEPLSLSQIQAIYLAGLPTHIVAVSRSTLEGRPRQ